MTDHLGYEPGAAEGVVQNKSAYIALGMGVDGHKKVLGIGLESTEGAKFWLKVISELKTRGVQDILIACCDGLKGFPQAIEAVFPKTVVQTCIVHMIRSSMRFVGWVQRKAVCAELRNVYSAPTEQAGLPELDAFGDARRVRADCAHYRGRKRVHLFGMKYIASKILHEFVNGVVFQRRKFHASSTRRCHHGFLRRTRTVVRRALSKIYVSDLTQSLRGSLRWGARDITTPITATQRAIFA